MMGLDASAWQGLSAALAHWEEDHVSMCRDTGFDNWFVLALQSWCAVYLRSLVARETEADSPGLARLGRCRG